MLFNLTRLAQHGEPKHVRDQMNLWRRGAAGWLDRYDG